MSHASGPFGVVTSHFKIWTLGFSVMKPSVKPVKPGQCRGGKSEFNVLQYRVDVASINLWAWRQRDHLTWSPDIITWRDHLTSTWLHQSTRSQQGSTQDLEKVWLCFPSPFLICANSLLLPPCLTGVVFFVSHPQTCCSSLWPKASIFPRAGFFFVHVISSKRLLSVEVLRPWTAASQSWWWPRTLTLMFHRF